MPALLRAAALLVGLTAVTASWFAGSAEAQTRPVRIVALGDSLTAGFGLAPSEAFPAQLERALAARGRRVTIANAGVSGDTAAGGLARLDWSVPEGTEAVILELGANDALFANDPARTEAALDAILTRLGQRRIPVLLAGMYAPRQLGPDYTRAFDSIYPRLARKHGAILYPFFLEGVVGNRTLNLLDGMHPNAAGINRIVEGILPSVEQLISRVRRG